MASRPPPHVHFISTTSRGLLWTEQRQRNHHRAFRRTRMEIVSNVQHESVGVSVLPEYGRYEELTKPTKAPIKERERSNTLTSKTSYKQVTERTLLTGWRSQKTVNIPIRGKDQSKKQSKKANKCSSAWLCHKRHNHGSMTAKITFKSHYEFDSVHLYNEAIESR